MLVKNGLSMLVKNNLFITILIYLIPPNECSQDVCKYECGRTHTLCFRKDDQCEPICGPGAAGRLLLKFQRWDILKFLNGLRSNFALGQYAKGINVTVANMRPYSYSMELEFVAQCWANLCKPIHDKCRSTRKFKNPGQNLHATSEESRLAIRISMQEWLKKVRKGVEIAQNYKKEYEQDYGDFTQIMWAENNEIGCGKIIQGVKTFVVCNFGPGGNIEGEPVYIEGTPCSKCRTGKCHNTYKGLCDELIVVEEYSPPFIYRAGGNRIGFCKTFYLLILFVEPMYFD